VSYLNSPRKGCPRGMVDSSRHNKLKTTSKKWEKMGDDLKKNGRRPKQIKMEDALKTKM
jgi:hypothetical protein